MNAHPRHLPGLFDPITPSAELFEGWFSAKFLPYKRAQSTRPDTLETTEYDIKLFLRFFRETFFRELTFADLNDTLAKNFFVWRMAQPRCQSSRTAKRSMRSIRGVWREAARDGLCYPPGEWQLGKDVKTMPTAWSMPELGRMLGEARDGPWNWYQPRGRSRIDGWQTPPVGMGAWLHALIYTLYYTGVRITALLFSPVANLDLTNRTLFVPAAIQKHKSDQWFPLPEFVVEPWNQLDVHGRGIERLGDDWPYDRKPGSNWKTLNNALKKLLLSAGLVPKGKPVSRKDLWHKIRRTCATHMAAKMGIEAASRWMGHSSTRITIDHYIDPRFMPTLNPVDALPRPTIPEQEVVSLALFREQAS